MPRRTQLVLAALGLSALLAGGIAIGAEDHFTEDSVEPAATMTPTSNPTMRRKPSPTPTPTGGRDTDSSDLDKVESGL